MSIETIVSSIDQELAKLQQARSALSGIAGGRSQSSSGTGIRTGAKRVISASARKRMAAAQRRRWKAYHGAKKRKAA
jgi:hypothetical protein